MRIVLITLVGMGLLACGAALEKLQEEGVMEKDQQLCNIEVFEALIGKDSSILETIDLPDPHRIIRPDSRVTKDLRRDRVNFLIDGQNKIVSVKCY